MRLTQCDEVIHALSPHRSDQSFGKAILPGRSRCGRLVPDAHGAQSACDHGSVDAITITDQVFWMLIPGECLGNLTRNPFSRCCDIDPDQLSAVQSDDDEGIEQVEANGRNDEQVHGGNVRRVVPQKGAPSLTWWPAPRGDHVFCDARLCDLKPELEQFAVDARRAPKRILDAHPPDQRAEVRLDLRPPSPRVRHPTPVITETGTMPPHECLRLDDRENPQNRRKPSIQLDQKPAIVVRQPDPTLHPAP